MLAWKVLVCGLVEHDDTLHSLIEQLHQGRESVAEETAHAKGDVDARMAELGKRDYFDPTCAAGDKFPHGFHTEHRQRLRDFVATGTHGRRTPHAQRDALRPAIFFGEESS